MLDAHIMGLISRTDLYHADKRVQMGHGLDPYLAVSVARIILLYYREQEMGMQPIGLDGVVGLCSIISPS